MKIYGGLDYACGVSYGVSRTALTFLGESGPIPIDCQIIKPDKKEHLDFDKRLAYVAGECLAVCREIESQGHEIIAVTIPDAKRRPQKIKHPIKDRITKRFIRYEERTIVTASMMNLAEMRGAIGAYLGSRYRIMRAVESKLKSEFTGNGRAPKELVLKIAQNHWPSCPKDFDVGDSYMDAWVCRVDQQF